jgi:hypothetical protein
MRVYATLPAVSVTKKGVERNKEIYIVSLASDLHGESNHRPLVLGATNETLKDISPTIKTAMKFFAVSVSNVFERIRADQPLSLSGDGIVLYPPADPNGMLALHFAIVESDRGTRRAGKILEGILGDSSVKTLLSEIAKLTAGSGNIPASVLTSLFGAVTEIIPTVVQKNKDDILFSHSHSGVDFNGYGGSQDGTSYIVGNDLANATLKIWARE